MRDCLRGDLISSFKISIVLPLLLLNKVPVQKIAQAKHHSRSRRKKENTRVFLSCCSTSKQSILSSWTSVLSTCIRFYRMRS